MWWLLRVSDSSACTAECAGEMIYRPGPCSASRQKQRGGSNVRDPTIKMSLQDSVAVMETTVFSFLVEINSNESLESWEMEISFERADTISSIVADVVNDDYSQDQHEVDFQGADGEFTITGKTSSSSTTFSFFAVAEAGSEDKGGTIQELLFNDKICKMDTSGTYQCSDHFSTQREFLSVAYGNSLGSQWEVSSTTATIKTMATSPTRDPLHVTPMLAAFKGVGNFTIRNRESFSGVGLQMWVFTTTSKASVSVSLATTSRTSNRVRFDKLIKANEWSKLSIPMKQFGVDPDSSWDMVVISNDKREQTQLYVDRIYILESVSHDASSNVKTPARPSAVSRNEFGARALEDPLKGCQVFSSDIPLAVPDSGSTKSEITLQDVPDLPITKVQLSMVHSRVGTLELSLRSPRGYAVGLAKQAGGNGANMIQTTFSSIGSKAMPVGTNAADEAPFTAEYMPVQQNSINMFSAVERKDTSTDHTWILRINDISADGRTGTLH